MPSSFSNAYTLMMWPWTQTQTNHHWLTMIQEAQEVMAARMPTLWRAFLSPWQADHAEIGLMWSEKTVAFGQSSKAVQRAGRRVEIAAKTQQKSISKARAGQMVTFFDLWEIYERNITAMASLSLLSTAVLKPIQAKVSANAKRLAAK